MGVCDQCSVEGRMVVSISGGNTRRYPRVCGHTCDPRAAM